MNTQTIPLDQLKPSPDNVRKTGGTPIYKLANSIHAHGLLQNLVVSPNGNGFHVEAGGRRLQALLELAKDGRIDKSYLVTCQVVDAGVSAHEASLAENVAREAMHPVDEFLAFKQLADEGQAVEIIANRFGATEQHIKQRLKLANVSPHLLAQYKAGNATLAQMQVLALVDDHKAQESAWAAGKRDSWKRNPNTLRQILTEREIGTDTTLGKFVGADAYEKAGGIVRRDLFGLAGEAWLTDPKLVERLAIEKLEKKAAELRKQGWAWVEVRLHLDYSDEYEFGQSKDKKIAGAIVTIGRHDGKLRTLSGLVRPGDQKGTSRRPIGEKKPVRKPGDLSFAAVQRLQAEATGILQAEIAELPHIAMALLAAELAGRAFYDHSDYGQAQRQWIHIQREHSGRMPGNMRDIIPESEAGQRFAALEQEWRQRLPQKKAELRGWILRQEFETITKLLAFLAARELDLVDIHADQKQGVVDLVEASKIDLAKHWKPTKEWLGTLPKATVIALAKDAGTTAVDLAVLAKNPKATLPAQALPHFTKGWLPPILRGRPMPKAKPATKKAAIPKAVSTKKVAKKTSRKSVAQGKASKPA